MSHAEGTTQTSAFPTDAAESPARRHGSLRAGSLIVCLIGLLTLALVGPNRVHALLFGKESSLAALTTTMTATNDSAHAMHYREAPLPNEENAAATLAPRLTGADHAKSAEAVAPARLSESSRSSQPAELVFRESVEVSRDRMRAIQQRLQLLGARYMLLETWGDVAPRYRFLCRMPDARGGSIDHEFVSEDPLDAMQRVLRQVEGRLAAR